MSAIPNEELIIGGRYRVVRALATGGMGTVYEAENLRTRRRVAIKTIRPEVASRVSVIHRFELEAQAAGQLQHPNIVEVLDLGDDPENQMLFSVQEFLVGGDLGTCLQNVKTLDLRATLATLLPILDALDVAHQHGVVHRDIKPDNIFLHETPSGVVPKIIDFGVAKLTDAVAERRSANGSLVGSPIYMSPEQVRASADIDGRTDVWSMGVVFYEALTGRTPFEGPSPYALLTQIALGKPLSLAELAPELPADVVAAIQRAVTQDRDERWQTTGEFAEALRDTATWRDVDPAEAARWIPNASGVPMGLVPTGSHASRKTPAAMTPVDPSNKSSGGHRSGLWSGEVAFNPHAPSGHGRTLPLIALGLCLALGVGVAISNIKRPEGHEHASAQVVRTRPAATVEVAPAPPPATPEPTTAPETMVFAPSEVAVAPATAIVPEVAPAPVVEVARPVRRRIVRRPVRRTAPVPEPAAPAVTRGFNGAPIVD